MRSGVVPYGEGQVLAVPALHKDGRELSIVFSAAGEGHRRQTSNG
jgi:hypothetical protein